jgi:hypothetical protein
MRGKLKKKGITVEEARKVKLESDLKDHPEKSLILKFRGIESELRFRGVKI